MGADGQNGGWIFVPGRGALGVRRGKGDENSPRERALIRLSATVETPEGGGDMDTVGIWSKNCPNWLIVDLALQAYGKVSVPLYDTLGAESVEHVTNHSELTIIFAAPEHIPHLLTIAPKLKTLKTIVSIEDLSDEEKYVLSTWAKTQNLKVMDLAEVEESGKASLLDVVQPSDVVIEVWNRERLAYLKV
ncbi:hypothetical protein NUW54_g14354 [Trametes sanguinea]|uniref:Uncharacterized protein n=1 Tax=Trametes sanguinea TaxID=158606 RepID=A0ACC1ME60_9APHY|nr:hypothetical protein NUW54_g14354 [Trametes sanguinea]